MCPYCQMGYMYHRTVKWYIDMDAVVCLSACCLDIIFLGAGYFGGSWWLRRRIRKRYQLHESAALTCAVGVCCAPCSLCQVHREMGCRGEHPGGVCIASPNLPPPPPMITMSALPNGGASPASPPYPTRPLYYQGHPPPPRAASGPGYAYAQSYSPQQNPDVCQDYAIPCTPACTNASQVFGGSYPTTPSDTKNGTPFTQAERVREGSPAHAHSSPQPAPAHERPAHL